MWIEVVKKNMEKTGNNINGGLGQKYLVNKYQLNKPKIVWKKTKYL